MPNANVEKIKASLLKEIKGVFSEGYCLYYKDDYYCGACPLNDTSNWLNRKKPIAREEKLRTVNFCDDCIHFRPLKEGEKQKPNNQLCEFVRPLRFRVGNGYNGKIQVSSVPGVRTTKRKSENASRAFIFFHRRIQTRVNAGSILTRRTAIIYAMIGSLKSKVYGRRNRISNYIAF